MSATPHLFGVRHHGPGSARALRAALEALSPDVLLVEGPPDADELLSFVGHAEMAPPIALLVHATEDPQLASFYPFAEFSPEWQALRYAAGRGIPMRFMDLPTAHALAARKAEAETEDEDANEMRVREVPLREDPIAVLANAAGFPDPEQWWDVQVEQRREASGLFDAIAEAMGALREQHVETVARELQREAHMRVVLAEAQKQGFSRIAVVCGAWHVPALSAASTPSSLSADAALLKGLPKLKVSATWIPWTHSRLAARSGYGAGVNSPGWYAHVWQHGERAHVVWATLAARLLREQGLDASSANVIETVRLAHTLASLRELPAPGLGELRDAIESVLCGGQPAQLALIRSQLEVGTLLGAVPEHAGQVPLLRDFEQTVKRLRLKPTGEHSVLELDLRKDTDRERSRLFHRLNALGVPWGRAAQAGKGSGTFKEPWQLAWHPELLVDLIAANLHGNTLETAASHALGERARLANLSELAQLIEVALLSHLPGVLETLLRELDARAATSSDVLTQMAALEPLARLARYGDVRETKSELVLPVLRGLFERVVIGLLPACTQLDDEAAATVVQSVARAHTACLLLDEMALKSDWLGALRGLLDSSAAHPLLRGRACRLLLEQEQFKDGDLGRYASLALSATVDPGQAAHWLEGLIGGAGLLLIHQRELLNTLDVWLAGLTDEAFQAQLPIVRRAFSGLAPAERRQIAGRVKQAASDAHAAGQAVPSTTPEGDTRLDERHVARVLPVLSQILGVSHV